MRWRKRYMKFNTTTKNGIDGLRGNLCRFVLTVASEFGYGLRRWKGRAFSLAGEWEDGGSGCIES